MAYNKQKINDILNDIAKQMDISDEMFKVARNEYTALGSWIDKESKEYDVSIYPQGSFALGTVVRPISGEDDYDVDLVCELAKDYGLSAKKLKKDVVKDWLVRYKHSSKEIEEKRKCWHVEYDDVPNFHMDVIPAYKLSELSELTLINITNHDEDNDTYEYEGSDPKGYIIWFRSRCQKRWNIMLESYSRTNNMVTEKAEQEPLIRNKVKTPLQRAIQILKRHRDIMFQKDPDDKPISIIITTLAAQLYNNEDSIVDALCNFLDGAEWYLETHKVDGKYVVEDPSYQGNNFADKWETNPERRVAFFDWLHRAQKDFNSERLKKLNRVEMGKFLNEAFGEYTGKAVSKARAQKEAKLISDNSLKVDTTNGNLSKDGTVTIPPNHHYGKE